ncbi:aminotransferase class V-fold PLP-dependent enzyme [Paraglaciecola sp. 2405UD69-4]|uniref:aminotransferase class V-fold PLP-dependent enzyme n=1 Tax=Paraglaciecola sp. 2405UD69-4 TaxID=3391836 RepID=UPI0039C958F4
MPFNPMRQHFSAFNDQSDFKGIYLDSGATTQKLQTVIDITNRYYQSSVNVHRSSYKLASDTTQKFEDARRTLQSFINAKDHREIVWTKGATESINLLAACLPRSLLQKGKNIVISTLEHHANIVPWQILAEQYGLTLKVMPINDNGVLLLEEAVALIDEHTVLVAIGHVSNALGNINPIKSIITKAKTVGALTLIDGTQAVSHMAVDVQDLDCDFYVFSGHKMFGPTGVGVFYGKLPLLENMPPYQVGGEMIKKVSFKGSEFLGPPLKFEAGTPNIAGVLGLAAAANFIKSNRDTIVKQELALSRYLQQSLASLTGIKIWGDPQHKIATFSFTVNGVNHYDLASYLNIQNISVRVGHHCAMPLMEALGVDGTIRVSISCYNTEHELTNFIEALKSGICLFTNNSDSVFKNKISEEKAVDRPGELALAISQAKSWDEKYRHIMLAGKSFPRLPKEQLKEDLEIFGCESQVWLKCELIDSTLYIQGDSPSKVVRGLLAIIFEYLRGKRPNEVLDFDLNTHLKSIGLDRYLSNSRANGIEAVLDRIFDFCKEYSNTQN